jgi:hypothetical protein
LHLLFPQPQKLFLQADRVAQEVACLLSKHEVLSSNPSTANTKCSSSSGCHNCRLKCHFHLCWQFPAISLKLPYWLLLTHG